MAYIIEVADPFRPLNEMAKHEHPGGITIRQWLELTYPGFVEFEYPTICLVNGQPVLRESWDQVIEKDDIVNFIRIQGYEWVVIIIVLLVIAFAIYMAVTTKTPETPGELPASSPVFSNQGKTNTIRLGEPIEVNYGRNRIYPSLASRPFYRYVDNDQFQHSLLCIGQGLYDIEAIQIGDTPIANFEEAEYEVLEPGDLPTLFSTNVVTSVEVGGQTLYGPNQTEYVAPGWVGPFPTNPPGTFARRIEIDLVFPRGMYVTDAKGRMYAATVVVEVMYRRIDDAGAPLTAYQELLDDTSITMRSTTPQRRTFGKDVTPGRYEVRARRTNNRRPPTKAGDQCTWEGMRGFISGDEPDYGDVTLLAVKIRATNNLNTRTSEKFNVVATRRLPMRLIDGSDVDSTGWSEPIATRSIIWAFVDVFRSLYGGRLTDDNFFDWDALYALDAIYTDRDEHFDWIFRDPITVWDAAKAIARVGRAVPLLSGSLVTMKRDSPLTVPVTLFNPENMLKGSFTWDIKLWEPNDYDSVSIEYTEVSTGYRQENVICTLPGGTSDHPEDVRLPGVQDRNHAYREGLFLLASRRYIRENISFETGLEGYIPSFGDLVAVAHDVPRWAQFGYVLAAEEMSGGYLIHVSEPLSFGESGEYRIMLRGNQGQCLGPYDVEEQSDPKQILVLIEDSEVDFLLGGKNEPMIFLFGIMESQVKYGRVVKIEPQGGERIRITVANNEPIVHTFDDLLPPPLVTPTFPDDPDFPTVTGLTLTQLKGGGGVSYSVFAAWKPTPGAISYVVQYSEDGGISWSIAPGSSSTFTFRIIQTSPGVLTVRVAAVTSLAQGPFTQESIIVTPVLGLEINPVPWNTLEWTATWFPSLLIVSYRVKIYDNTDPDNPVLKRTEDPPQQLTPTYVYDYLMATADGNLVRDHRLEVDVVVINEDTGLPTAYELPAVETIHNLIPEPPLHPDVELDEIVSDGDYMYRFFWDNPAEEDLYKVKLWVSQTPGFDPEVEVPVMEATATPTPGYTNLVEELFYQFALLPGNIHPDLYWRIGLFDVWGNEIDTNISDEGSIIPVWLDEGGEWHDEGRWEDGETWED